MRGSFASAFVCALVGAACSTTSSGSGTAGGDDGGTAGDSGLDATAAGDARDGASAGDDLGDASSGDGSGGCGAGQTSCNGTCVSTMTDPANCGSCGHACSGTFTCQAGVCASTETCPPPPANAPPQAAAAITKENAVRAAMGIACASLVDALDTASANHCAYYAANQGNPMCIANPHVEVQSCSMYTGAQFFDRDSAAGYGGQPQFEDMAFLGDGAGAVQELIDTVWHRTPILSPWNRDVGYGGASGCDTMDFGVGASTPDTTTATYPYDGQTGVPAAFAGNEGPPPPAPPNGWPSGYPIHIYLRGGSVSSHVLTLKGNATPIAHVWLASGDAAAMGLLPDEYVMYANQPLSGATAYHVHVDGKQGGNPIAFDWNFTTQ
jgi:hypothetical protein